MNARIKKLNLTLSTQIKSTLSLRARSIALSPPSNRETEDLSPLRKGNFPLDPFATN